MTPEVCACGRPKYTVDDLTRWFRELGEYDDTVDAFPFNPAWAKAVCWTMRGTPCIMRVLRPDAEVGAEVVTISD